MNKRMLTASAFTLFAQAGLFKSDVPSLKPAEAVSTIEKSSGVLVVKFWASWCGPCKKMNPIFKKLAQNGNHQYYSLNADQADQACKKYKITSLPTVSIFKDGEHLGNIVGVMSESDLSQKIEKFLSKN